MKTVVILLVLTVMVACYAQVHAGNVRAIAGMGWSGADASNIDADGAKRSDVKRSLDPKIPRVCTYPLETGPCKARQPRYGFVPSKNECVLFTYGGCRGNENRFETKEQCEKKCKRSSKG